MITNEDILKHEWVQVKNVSPHHGRFQKFVTDNLWYEIELSYDSYHGKEVSLLEIDRWVDTEEFRSNAVTVFRGFVETEQELEVIL